MQLFQNRNGFTDLKEKPFKLEREMQNLFEKNLTQITGLEFVKSEFSIQSKRLDTLAFDTENKSLVIKEK